MKLTFEELYAASKNEVVDLKLQIKIREAVADNPEIQNLINKLKVASTDTELDSLKQMYQQMITPQKKEEKKTDEETISEIYGISLDNIEHFRLKDGKEYYKFYDINTGKDYILKQNDKSKNLSEEFKEIQAQVENTQKYSSSENAAEVFKYQRVHTNNEVKLYSIKELENNPSLLLSLNKQQMKAISTLIKNKDTLHINKINPETGIAIDARHKVITATYNEATNECDISEPKHYQYSNDIESAYNGYYMEDIEIADDVPTLIDGVEIDYEKVELLYKYPEIMEKDNTMTPKQKNAYAIAIEIYKKILAKRKQKQTTSNQKVFVKKHDYKKAGFMDTILLATITGFSGGVILTIILNIISK